METIPDEQSRPDRRYVYFRLMNIVKESLEHMEIRDIKCATILRYYFRYKGGDQKIKNYKDIAEATGRNPSGIGKDIQRCMKKFMAMPEIKNVLEELRG